MRQMDYEDLLWWKAYLATLPSAFTKSTNAFWSARRAAEVADATLELLRVRLMEEIPAETVEDDL